MNRFILDRARNMYEDTKKQQQISQQPSMKFIQTNFEDNHSLVQVSGGSPNITITVTDGKTEVKTEEPVQEAEVVDDVIDELKKIFYGDANTAKTFLGEIQGMKPLQITNLVKKYLAEEKLHDLSARRDLWSILHDKGFYEPSESYWDRCLK